MPAFRSDYPKIVTTGDGNAIGRGVRKAGVQNNLPVVSVRRC